MYKTWFFDEDAKHFQDVKEIIESYDFKFWLMCHEEFNKKGEKKPHYHILVELKIMNCENDTIKPWNNLLKKLKIQYKLTEKNKLLNANQKGRGGVRCFGAYPIHDGETYKKYLAKDGMIAGNIPDIELNKLIEESQTKLRNDNWKNDTKKYVLEHYHDTRITKQDPPNDYINPTEYHIYLCIAEYYEKHDQHFTKAVLQNMYSFIVSTNKDFKTSTKLNLILYNR